jgi:hypothetical protein
MQPFYVEVIYIFNKLMIMIYWFTAGKVKSKDVKFSLKNASFEKYAVWFVDNLM